MKVSAITLFSVVLWGLSKATPFSSSGSESRAGKHLRPVLSKRQEFNQGQPVSADGKGARILGIPNFSVILGRAIDSVA